MMTAMVKRSGRMGTARFKVVRAGQRADDGSIVIAVGIEKMGLCVIVLAGWGDAFMTALRPAALVDGIIVVLFGLYLLSGATSRPDPSRVR